MGSSMRSNELGFMLVILKLRDKVTFLVKYLSYRIRESLVFRHYNRSDVFKKIYQLNYWNDGESVSGFGSTLNYTENVRKELPLLINRYNIRSMLDAPCGDFNWMRHVVTNLPVTYVGADIVEELSDNNNKLYGTSNIRFITLDIVTDDLPECDLMVCRDCLFHLPTADVQKFFTNFARHNIKYLLTTTHINDGSFVNTDILPGRFRKIDLFSSPYCLPSEVISRFDDYMLPEPPREMVLVERNAVLRMIEGFS